LKFQPDSLAGVNVVTAFAPGRVIVNADTWTGSVIVPWRGEVRAWAPTRPEDLGVDHVADVLACRPEVVLYGSGPRLCFPPPAVMRALIEARVGYETMDSGAACRTYNVLATEGRRVVLAVLA
jgi:uncharacterized protein